MMGRQACSESLFYYFRLEDQIPEDLWFLKTFRTEAAVSAFHSKVELSTGLFVLPLNEPPPTSNKQTQVV